MEAIRESIAEFTRPADTTAYAVGDSIANSTSAPAVLTFASSVPNKGERGVVRGAILHKSTPSVTNATFRLHLYKTSVTPTNDNAALSVLYADRKNYIGHITFTAKQTQASGGAGFAVGVVTDSTNSQIMELPFIAYDADNAIYGILEATGAYTPGSAETFSVKLIIQSGN